MKKNKLFIGAIGLGIAFTALTGLAFTTTEADSSLCDISINEEYLLGTQFSVPEATITVGGVTCPAQSVIVFPDGGQYKTSSVTLSQVGNYRIDYSCYVDNKKYTESVDFYVYNTLYQTNNSVLASATYYDEYVVDEFDGTTSTLSGILVELPSGSNFQFNQVIDLSDKTKVDELLNFLILPEKIGEADFETLYFEFTDIYDSKNVVRVSYQKRRSGVDEAGNTIYLGLQGAYAKGGSSLQPMVGYEQHANGDIYHANNIYGTPFKMSFCGVPSIKGTYSPECNGYLRDGFTSLSMDYQEREIYGTSAGLTRLITDMDNSKFYTDMWDGFTTGEVYLTIYAREYTGSNNAKLFLKNVNGLDLSENRLDDTVAPKLTVDLDGLDAYALPDAVVGYSYPVFKAKALDSVYGETEVKTSVYYNYNSTNCSLCNIVDGRVNITRSGIYTIIYESSDGSGNTAKQSYTFMAKENMDSLSASLVGQLPQTVNVGEKLVLPDLIAENYVQSYKTSISVACGQENIPINNQSFVPKSLGAYTVKYTVKDFVNRETELSYTVNVQDVGKPVIYEDVRFPSKLISGKAYEYPVIEAYDYSSSNTGKTVEVKRYITDGNARREITGVTFTPVVQTSGSEVVLEYVAENASGAQTVMTYKVPCYVVKSGDNLDISKFFIKQGDITITPQSLSTLFTTTQNKSGFEFINVLLADNFSIDFNVDKENNAFTSFNVYLTDAENEKIQIKVAFEKSGDIAIVRLNNSNNTFDLASSYDNEVLMTLTFNAFVNTITTEYNESITLPVVTTLFGDEFNGFPSGKVYLRCEFDGVNGSAGIEMQRISGQPILTLENDSIRPAISILGEYKALYALNTTLTLYPAIALDVLDPEVTFTMSVRAPNKRSYLKDVNTGLELKDVPVGEYTIQLKDFGEYMIIYKAVDSSGCSLPLSQPLTVIDNVKPTITLNGTLPAKMKVGEEITLPSAIASDNLDGELDSVYIYVQEPRGFIKTYVGSMSEEYKFIPKEKGLYVVKYCVIDEAGNFTIVNYEIKVS